MASRQWLGGSLPRRMEGNGRGIGRAEVVPGVDEARVLEVLREG